MKKERGNFRPVYTSIWDDEDFKSFDSDTKVVFFNLRTSRFGNWPCIYVMYPENVSAQTGIPLKKVMGSLMTLSMKSWIAHIPPVVWIVKGLRNDPNWNPVNSKQVSGIEEQLRSLPKNPLLVKFCKFYGLSFSWISTDDPIDRPIDDPIDESTDVPTDGTGDVSRKPGDVSRKPEKEPLSGKPDDAPPYEEIISHLNEKAGTAFRVSGKGTRSHIHARWKEGFTLDQFRAVIDKKCAQWKYNHDMDQYLRPKTLFGNNFESYLNQKEVRGNGSGNQGVHGSSAQVGNVKARPGKYAGIGTSVCTDTPDAGGDPKGPPEDGEVRGSAEKVS